MEEVKAVAKKQTEKIKQEELNEKLDEALNFGEKC